uniref:L-serine ammonia-lyase n=3 Tax=Pygocentrus nattereri TaxID=42514 RepID=A0A3B4DCH4_PYGNA
MFAHGACPCFRSGSKHYPTGNRSRNRSVPSSFSHDSAAQHTAAPSKFGPKSKQASLLTALAMEDVTADSITLQMLQEARDTVTSSPLGVISTPLIPWCQTTLPSHLSCNIHLKLENMQRTGSFKIRGVANQFARQSKDGHFVTMSAGNYGKSFAYASKHYGTKGKVVMPETAPMSRSLLIQSFGIEVERVPTPCLMDLVNRCVQEDNMTFMHSYNDPDLIAGHASLGFEILEVVPNPDVVVVCCGGGGLLAGVAAAIKLSGCERTRIYGVEPEGACTMYKSFIEKKPVGMDSKSIASGLAPPFAGALPYALCQKYVEKIVLVTDEEIKSAVSTLYRAGLVVEPSGSAAFAAIVNDRIPDITGKNIVIILSGGNIGKDELMNFPD